jgi:endonuclease-8
VPEGDTVSYAAARLRPALEGRVLTRTDFRVPRFATTDLSGRRLDEIATRGKHLLFRVGGGLSIHSHFGMEGEWIVHRPGQRWRGPSHQARLVLENDSAVAVGFRLKITEVVSSADEDRLFGHLGPDVLGADWDEEEVLRRMSEHRERPIGETLIDQRVLAGPGNVYKSEVCFLSGVNPFDRVRDVGDLAAVVKLTKRLMEANRSPGRQVPTGDLRRGRGQWVYGRGGQPCRRCRTPVERAESSQLGGRAGRVTYWCPSCQPARSVAVGLAAEFVDRAHG